MVTAIWLIACGVRSETWTQQNVFSSKCSKRLVTHQSESQPMGIHLILVRSARRWAVMLCTGPTTISTIDWNKIIVASNSATTQCVALELFHLPHAFVEPSMKCVSSFGSVPF